eukprot:TRINITY_DN1661_c0_g1_i10.p2 TRINITY_DN1661_c0_g1~~TRINITY_DN1661_c0_g1_i10.p2  ORF type:complete len:533 (-),score=49.45 TRINITY_DN1661_c0_g1_i10:1826-3424(-)
MSQAGVVGQATYNGTSAKTVLGCAQTKVDQFLLEWLSLEETQTLVASLSECSINPGAKLLYLGDDRSEQGASPLFGVPPLSPRTTSPRSHFSPRRQLVDSVEQQSHAMAVATADVLEDHSETIKQSTSCSDIPSFYSPQYRSRKITESENENLLSKVQEEFSSSPEGMLLERFVPFAVDVLGLPEILGIVLFQRLKNDTNKVDGVALNKWVKQTEYIALDASERTFEVLKADITREFLIEDDIYSMVLAALEFHPGLEFLKSSPDFQKRYAQTVVYRIFYDLGCRPTYDRIYLRALKHNRKLISALQMLDDDIEVNRELNYFSYEHFYVIYCKFWELDTDQDMALQQEDILVYGSCALTYKITQKIFQGIPKKLEGKQQNTMSYKDFVWFILSEEDKTSETAIDYWFRCVDLDGDGYINDHDVRYFYDEQHSRMECMNQETIQVDDILAQLSDMLKPNNPRGVTRQDLMKQGKLAATFFDVLFNIHKFWTLENSDPFAVKQERAEVPDFTDWQLFAVQEYARMMYEEESLTT